MENLCLCDEKKYVVEIRTLNQGLTHGLMLQTLQRVIKFNEKSRLKSYVDMNTELRKRSKS